MSAIRVALTVGALSVALLLDPTAAAGGGSTWEITPDPAAPGQPVHAEAVAAWTHNDGLGTPADGPWRAWIRPTAGPTDFRGGTSRITEDATLVGDITIVDEGGFGTATVDFVVPDLAAGEYELIHCNEPCTSSLGDITWGAFTITEPESSENPTPTTPDRHETEAVSSPTSRSGPPSDLPVTSPHEDGAVADQGAPTVGEREVVAGLLVGGAGLLMIRRLRSHGGALRRSGSA